MGLRRLGSTEVGLLGPSRPPMWPGWCKPPGAWPEVDQDGSSVHLVCSVPPLVATGTKYSAVSPPPRPSACPSPRPPHVQCPGGPSRPRAPGTACAPAWTPTWPGPSPHSFFHHHHYQELSVGLPFAVPLKYCKMITSIIWLIYIIILSPVFSLGMRTLICTLSATFKYAVHCY